MKTVHFNINDWWIVTLTQHGAEILNKLHKEYQEKYPNLQFGLRTDYKSGEDYKQQGWEMMNIFGDVLGLGLESPFHLCEVEVESSSYREIKE